MLLRREAACAASEGEPCLADRRQGGLKSLMNNDEGRGAVVRRIQRASLTGVGIFYINNIYQVLCDIAFSL